MLRERSHPPAELGESFYLSCEKDRIISAEFHKRCASFDCTPQKQHNPLLYFLLWDLTEEFQQFSKPTMEHKDVVLQMQKMHIQWPAHGKAKGVTYTRCVPWHLCSEVFYRNKRQTGLAWRTPDKTPRGAKFRPQPEPTVECSNRKGQRLLVYQHAWVTEMLK